MTDAKPLVPVNPEGLEEIAKSLLKGDPQIANTGTNVRTPESYIILPGKMHGSYSYPDLLVAMHRLSYEAELAAKTLGSSLQNTATEQDGSQYIGNINWEQALRLNLLLGNFTLTPRQFVDFKELLEEGVKGKKVYDGKGAVIDSKVLEEVHDEIFAVRSPYRAEWLDAYFKAVDDRLQMNYNHRMVNGVLKPQNSEQLKKCLMQDSYVSLASANRQGLPTRKSKSQMYYLYPRDKAVAGFIADSDWVGLYCNGSPKSLSWSVGVRAARLK